MAGLFRMIVGQWLCVNKWLWNEFQGRLPSIPAITRECHEDDIILCIAQLAKHMTKMHVQKKCEKREN